MVQLEGPIVQSIYDTALMSWWTTLNPRPPLLYETPSYPDKLDRSAFKFGTDHPLIHAKGDLQAMAERTVQRLAASTDPSTGRITPSSRAGAISPNGSARTAPMSSPAISMKDVVNGSAASTSPVVGTTPLPVESPVLPPKGDGHATAAPNGTSSPTAASVVSQPASSAAHSSASVAPQSPTAAAASLPPDIETPAPRAPVDFTPVIVHEPHDPFPVALVNRTPRGRKFNRRN